MCDEDTVDGDAEDVITIVKRIDRRLLDGLSRMGAAALVVDPDAYDDEPTEGVDEPGPEEPALEVAKRLLQRAEENARYPVVAAEYREQAEVWITIHMEEH